MLKTFYQHAITEKNTNSGLLVVKILERRALLLGIDSETRIEPIQLQIAASPALVVRLRGPVERDRHTREVEAIYGAEGTDASASPSNGCSPASEKARSSTERARQRAVQVLTKGRLRSCPCASRAWSRRRSADCPAAHAGRARPPAHPPQGGVTGSLCITASSEISSSRQFLAPVVPMDGLTRNSASHWRLTFRRAVRRQ
jgi:hypothetical protein